MQKTVHPAMVTSQVDNTHQKPNCCLFPITPKLNSNGIPKNFRLSGFDFHHLSAAPSLGNHLTTSTAGRIVGVHPQDWIATSPTGLVSCENPTFFLSLCWMSIKRSICQWKSRFSSRYVSGIPKSYKNLHFSVFSKRLLCSVHQMPFAAEHFGQCQPIVLPYLSCTADFLFATSPFGEFFFILQPTVPSGKKRSKTTKPCLLSIPQWQKQ